VTLGAHLASIHTPEENDMVHTLCDGVECWIGFNDVGHEGVWGWSDGSVADFSVGGWPDGLAPWNPGEPNGQQHDSSDGAYMYATSSPYVMAGTWDDDDIGNKRRFVCRFPSPPPPPPSPPPLPRPLRLGDFEFCFPPLNYTNAEAACVQKGGHLAAVRSMADNEQILSLCKPEACWIGFNDMKSEGTWVWTDGLPSNFSGFPDGYAPWNPGEPNGDSTTPNSDGAYMYPNTNAWVREGTWDDGDVAKTKPYVCQYGSGAGPSPLGPSAAEGGGGGAVWTVLLICAFGIVAVWYVKRQKTLGRPIIPQASLPNFGGTAPNRPVEFDRERPGQPAAEYTPPLSIAATCSSTNPPAALGAVPVATPVAPGSAPGRPVQAGSVA
jgi:hypothetical protein